MKKMILAISMDAPATPPKPRMPAISATIRKVTTQPNITRSYDPLSVSIWREREHRVDYRNNPGLEQRFRAVPEAAKIKIPRQKERNPRPAPIAKSSGPQRDNSCQSPAGTPICPSILL